MESKMKKVTSFASLIFVTLISGCTTMIDWSATGGSRSDGVVRLSYQVKEFQKAVLSEQQAIDLATKRCNAWGYRGAEAFGGATRQCVQNGGFGGCAEWRVTKEYQCTESSKEIQANKWQPVDKYTEEQINNLKP